MKIFDEPLHFPPFQGFRPKAMAFLRALVKNQNKEWFAANKTDYEKFVRGPLQSLVADVGEQLVKAKLPFNGNPRRAIFRINRDIRFTKDKRPYKTHAGAALTRDGNKHSPGVLYIHIEPAGSFIATGFYHPEPIELHALREGLIADPARWKKTERALAKVNLTLAKDDTLVRIPKGFEIVSPELAEVLKLKSWVVRRDLSASDIAGPGLVKHIVAFAKETKPLLSFGWDALENAKR